MKTLLRIICSFCLIVNVSHALDLSEARNIPEKDKVLFIIGQDSDTNAEYKAEVLDIDIEMPRPGGFTIYSPLTFFPGFFETPLNSLFASGNWGDREHNLSRTLADYPDSAVAIGLNFVDCVTQQPLRSLAGVGDPDVVELTPIYHDFVDQMVELLKASERQVFLRIGYEFDGPWNCYDPEMYKTTFRFIKSRIDALEADNIATVWQGAGWIFPAAPEHTAFNPGHLDQWYPGDEYVDWMGMSIFWGENFEAYQVPGASQFAPILPRELQNQMMDFARLHNKPVMIAEASPQSFDLSASTASTTVGREEIEIPSQEIWDVWFADLFSYVEANRDVIRALAYINADWNTAPLWRCDVGSEPGTPVDPNDPTAPACPAFAYWGDARIQTNEVIYQNFKAELQKDFYVNGGEGINLPGPISTELIQLHEGESTEFKLLVEDQSIVAVKMIVTNSAPAKIKVTVNGESVIRSVKKGSQVFKFELPRDQHFLTIESLEGEVDLAKINAKLKYL